MTETAVKLNAYTFREFLESVPPGTWADVSDLYSRITYAGGGTLDHLNTTDILMHCSQEICQGMRLFGIVKKQTLERDKPNELFLSYRCKNCGESLKRFSVLLVTKPGSQEGSLIKYGEIPAFGPPTPSRLIGLLGPDKDLFLKGRRSENQGLGIAAFAYYRRVVENQKNRILGEIVRVSERLGADPDLLQDLERAKTETQFTKRSTGLNTQFPRHF